MSRWQFASLIVLLSCLLLLGIWDSLAYVYGGGRKSTISYLFTMGSFHAPIIVFLLGVLVGHLFWPLTCYREDLLVEKQTEIVKDEAGNIKSIRSWYVEKD